MPYFMANPLTTTLVAATILYLTCIIWLCIYYRVNTFPPEVISLQVSVAISSIWSRVDKTRVVASLQELVPCTIFSGFLILLVLGPPYMAAIDWTDKKVREWYRARQNRNTFDESIT